MISDELKTIVEQLKEQGEMHFFEPAKDEQIEQFEKNCAVTLPRQFKEWLLFSDGGMCFLPAGIQLYGVAHKPIIDISDKDVPSDDYIVIGRLATGDPILCRKDSKEISIYNHEADRIEDDERYENFFDFLNDLYQLLGIGE